MRRQGRVERWALLAPRSRARCRQCAQRCLARSPSSCTEVLASYIDCGRYPHPVFDWGAVGLQTGGSPGLAACHRRRRCRCKTNIASIQDGHAGFCNSLRRAGGWAADSDTSQRALRSLRLIRSVSWRLATVLRALGSARTSCALAAGSSDVAAGARRGIRSTGAQQRSGRRG